MQRIPVLILLLALFAAACGDDADVSAAQGPGDSGTRPSVAGDWIVQSLTVDGAVVTLPGGDLDMTIELGEIRGNLGCNSFFGEIDAADDGSLAISASGQTEMACVEQVRMDFEATYGQALSSVSAWDITPTALTLSGAATEIVYGQAAPPVHQPLEATVWTFDSIYEGDAVTNQAGMDAVTVVIEDGVAALNAPSCAAALRFGVEYSGDRDGSWAPVSQGDDGVAYDCGEADAMIELAYQKLQASTGFMINENRLTFIGEAGETVGFSASSNE